MNEFLRLFWDIAEDFPLTIDIHYSKISDWVIDVRKRGCAFDYPKSLHRENDALLFHIAHPDPTKLFDIATRLLIRWMKRNEPRYIADLEELK